MTQKTASCEAVFLISIKLYNPVLTIKICVRMGHTVLTDALGAIGKPLN